MLYKYFVCSLFVNFRWLNFIAEQSKKIRKNFRSNNKNLFEFIFSTFFYFVYYYLFTIFEHGETSLKRTQKEEDTEPKTLFSVRVPIIVVLTPSARFQCEGTLLRVVCNVKEKHLYYTLPHSLQKKFGTHYHITFTSRNSNFHKTQS